MIQTFMARKMRKCVHRESENWLIKQVYEEGWRLRKLCLDKVYKIYEVINDQDEGPNDLQNKKVWAA